jgi:hypothetical protein
MERALLDVFSHGGEALRTCSPREPDDFIEIR